MVCTASKAVGVTCTDPTKTNIFMENGEPAVLGSVVQGTMLYFGFNGELTTRRRRSLTAAVARVLQKAKYVRNRGEDSSS